MNPSFLGHPNPIPSATLTRLRGVFYPPAPMVPGSNGTIAVGTLFAIPFEIGPRQRFDRIAFTNLGVASSFIRLGMFADVPSGIGRCLLDTGQIDTATLGDKTYPINMELEGWAWVAAVGQGVAPSVARMGICYSPKIGSQNVYSIAFGGMAYSQTGITGALPPTWGSALANYTIVSAANTAPILYLRSA